MEKQLYVQSQVKGEFIATLFWCLIRQVRSFVVQSLDETFRQPKIPSLIVELNFGFLSVVCILNYFKIIAFVLKRRSFPILLLQEESEGNFSVYSLQSQPVTNCNLIVIYHPSSHSQRSIHLQSTLIDLHLNF